MTARGAILRGRVILIAQQDPDLRAMFRQLFEGAQAQVVEAATTEQALACLSSLAVDLILTDLRLSHDPQPLFTRAHQGDTPVVVVRQGHRPPGDVQIIGFDAPATTSPYPTTIVTEATRLIEQRGHVPSEGG